MKFAMMFDLMCCGNCKYCNHDDEVQCDFPNEDGHDSRPTHPWGFCTDWEFDGRERKDRKNLIEIYIKGE